MKWVDRMVDMKYDECMEKDSKLKPFGVKDALKVAAENPYLVFSVIMLTILAFR
jgi:hypothetical protein